MHAIVQDRHGYMWFGTQEGLNRYDGFEFRYFLHDLHDPSTIGDDWIWDLFDDADGNIWIGTDGGGLNRYRYDTNSFQKYLHDPDDATSISGNDVREVFQDSEGRFWIGTESNGLNLFDPASGRFNTA